MGEMFTVVSYHICDDLLHILHPPNGINNLKQSYRYNNISANET